MTDRSEDDFVRAALIDNLSQLRENLLATQTAIAATAAIRCVLIALIDEHQRPQDILWSLEAQMEVLVGLCAQHGANIQAIATELAPYRQLLEKRIGAIPT